MTTLTDEQVIAEIDEIDRDFSLASWWRLARKLAEARIELRERTFQANDLMRERDQARAETAELRGQVPNCI